MKQLKVEIQVTFLAVIIAAAMIASGYWVYLSLSRIIDSIYIETRPDLKLSAIKDIESDLNKVENNVRLFALTGDAAYINSYNGLNGSVREKLNTLKSHAGLNANEKGIIDSINVLTTEKLRIWKDIKTLYDGIDNLQHSFEELYSKIDTGIIFADTIIFTQEQPERKGLLKRIFSGRDSLPPSQHVIIDKSEDKETLKKEIERIEQLLADREQNLRDEEKKLLEANMRVTTLLDEQIARLESSGKNQLRVQTDEADTLAAQTYRKLTIFTIAAVVLLMVVLIIFFRNVHKNKAYQQLLKQAKTEAESLAKAKEMFVATVTHEMRTPVHAIFGITEQMISKITNRELSADLEVVNKSAASLITLINDTLDFSKIESHKLQLTQIDFLPSDVFREVYVLNKDSAGAKGIRIVEDDKTPKGLALKGDPARLKQILINIVSNALKFTNDGEVRLTAACAQKADSKYWLTVEVSDTGIGIPDKDRDRIFDEFVQLDNTAAQKNRGTGLGLAIAKKLTLLQGGIITVDSAPGEGTVFTVKIPYEKGDINNIHEIAAPAPLPIPDSVKKLHFLVVDDEEFNLYLLSSILNKWGVSFEAAGNGQEAVSMASAKHYDLIFMDLRMPVMNGHEAARLILQTDSDTRIIALTAADNHDDIRKSYETGMAAHIRKPFTEAELLNTVAGLFADGDNPPGQQLADDSDTDLRQSVNIAELSDRNQERVPPTDMGKLNATDKNEGQLIDLSELERTAGGDKTLMKELAAIFLRTSAANMELLEKNAETENWSAVADIAHKLAPSVRHMGANKLYDTVKTLESEAREGLNTVVIMNLVNDVGNDIKQISILLERYYKD